MKLLFFAILSIMHFAKCTTLEDEAQFAKHNLLASLNMKLKDPTLNRLKYLNKSPQHLDDKKLKVETIDNSKKNFIASIEELNLAKKQTQAEDQEKIRLTIQSNIQLIERSYLTSTLDEKVVIISQSLKYYIFENKQEEGIIYILLNQSNYQIYSQEELNSYLINKDILKTDSNENLHDKSPDKSLKNILEIDYKEPSIIEDQPKETTLAISVSPYINLKDAFVRYDATLNEPDNLTLFVLSCTSNLILTLPIKTQTKVELGKEYFFHNDPFMSHTKGEGIGDKKNYIIQQLLSAYAGSDITEVNETTEEHMVYIINNLPYHPPFTIEMKPYNEENILLANAARDNHIVREERKRYPSNPPIKIPGLIIFNDKIFTFNEYFFFFIKHAPHNQYMLINQEQTIYKFII